MIGCARLLSGVESLNSFAQTIRALGLTRLVILGAVIIGVGIFFIFLMGRMSAPNMALLFGGLTSKDAGEIVAKLDAQRVPYQLAGDGTQIMVPADQVLRVRMSLAEEGLPVGGSVGYEIFDQGEAFGTTSLVQNVNMLRALEGELARTIGSLGPVAGARVHLVVPKREVFSRSEVEPSASIALKLRGAAKLNRQQIAAIQNLVAAAVPGLAVGRIAIVDDAGNLLARGDGGGASGAGGSNAEDNRIAFEERVARSIEEIVERIVGFGKVRAEVSADIDFDRLTTNDEIFNPDGQVIRRAGDGIGRTTERPRQIRHLLLFDGRDVGLGKMRRQGCIVHRFGEEELDRRFNRDGTAKVFISAAIGCSGCGSRSGFGLRLKRRRRLDDGNRLCNHGGLGRDRIAVEHGVQLFDQVGVGSRRLGLSLLDHREDHLDPVDRGEDQRDRLRTDWQLAIADLAEHVLRRVRQRFQSRQADEAAGALDGVNQAENARDELGFRVLLELDELDIERCQAFGALGQKFTQ